ncbi:MAG: FAD-dependent oxidoreductase, partial [Candidatus Heritagella sp.]
GQADCIAMCRAQIADPHWANKARRGRADEIRPCLRCTNCIGEMCAHDRFSCDVNPLAGHESRLKNAWPQPERRLKTVIVGGGPAGMQAAITAAERGHQVILLEKSDHLGGLLTYTDFDTVNKFDLHRFKEYLIREVNRHAVEVHLNTEASPEMVAALQPDAVMLAIGSDPVFPPIAGLVPGRVTLSTEAYQAPDALGKRVVVIGGGLVGAETAVYLADRGHEVTVVEREDLIAKDGNVHYGPAVREQVEQKVTALTGTSCVAVTETGVMVEDRKGNRFEVPADSIVLAAGMKSRGMQAEAYRACAPDFYRIGDCGKVGRVKTCIHTAYHAAMSLGCY